MDGWVVCGANNDEQFKRFAAIIGRQELGTEARFLTNAARLQNRAALVAIVTDALKTRSSSYWVEAFEKASLPCCPVNTLDQVFADPHVEERAMRISMPHPLAPGRHVDLIGSPIKLSDTPVSYRRAPPTLGKQTDEVLQEVLGLDAGDRAALRKANII